MDTVVRTAVVYIVLLAIIRLAGRRALSQLTAFDLIVLLIIGGTTQRALLGQDYSVTSAILVVLTLIVLDVLLTLVERDVPAFSRLLNGGALILIEHGRLLPQRLRKARLTEDEVMAAARRAQGIERIEDIKFAILETTGDISIIPKDRV